METTIINLRDLPKPTKEQTFEDLKANSKYRAAYHQHSYNAKKRKIPFHLTYSEWLEIWQQSGHLESRGKNAGCYVMSRFGDKGAYEVGNVFISRMEDNVREGNKGIKKSTRHAAKLRKLLNKVRFKRAVYIDGKFYASATEAGLEYNMTRQNVIKRCKSSKWKDWKAEGVEKEKSAEQIRMSDKELKQFGENARMEERNRVKQMVEQREYNNFLLSMAKEAKSSAFAKGNKNDPQ